MQTLKLDIVSDIVCPWCLIGYKRLEQAMETLADELRFEIDWHPFELNPDLPPEGEPSDLHIQRKYGLPPAEAEANRSRIVELARELGVNFYQGPDRRIYNTFDAHRVLHWAREQGRQQALELALFEAYFVAGRNPSEPQVLREAAESAGLDGTQAEAIARSDDYAEAVRAEEQVYLQAGISAVPAFIIEERYLISGGQEPATFVEAFREIAAGTASSA